MEIAGEIKSKHVDQIRLITSDKKQEIDVFYTEIMKFDVEKLVVSEMVVFDVRLQSIDYYGLKMGKFWLKNIIFPVPPPPKHGRKQKVHFGHLQKKNEFGEYIE